MKKDNKKGTPLWKALLFERRLPWRYNIQIQNLKWKCYIDINPFKSAKKIKSFIFCTSYINDARRYKKWIDYYYSNLKYFGADKIFLINDGKKNVDFDKRLNIIDGDKPLPDHIDSNLNIIKFSKHFGRSEIKVFPGWWRSFTFSVKIAKKYSFNKIIHIESDAYVLSLKLADYLKKSNRGWSALWCPKSNMPETAIQIICQDSFNLLEKYFDKGKKWFFKNHEAEYILPFKKVNKKFKGDRYGKDNKQIENPDYYCQTPIDLKLISQFITK